MEKEEFIKLLDNNPELKKDLFIRGFLITNNPNIDYSVFPFYSEWDTEIIGGYTFAKHKLTGFHYYASENGNVYFLFGHAYNPFEMVYEEDIILKNIAKADEENNLIEKINELTGVFVFGSLKNGKLNYLVDPSGIQSACSGIYDGFFYLTSHSQIIGDIFSLEMSDISKELVAYKWFKRVMGPYLPADLTQFDCLKRIVPDILYEYDGNISHKRFWPLSENKIANEEKDYNDVISKSGDLLKNNMILITQKWKKPMISLTGGIDSNTTFAAANGVYDRFETFSYISAEKETSDAEAAKTISSHFNLKHHEYHIPDQNSEIKDFEIRRELFRHNSGYISELYDNEARKKLYLRDNAECDVEVKSWVSETIRAYWYKHYGRKTMPKLSPKLFRNLYKIFICNRKLAHKVDKLFADYIRDFEYDKIPSSYPAADMHFAEVTWGSWGGLNISEMKYCFDITIIYNNRKFLELMFKAPLEKRISDEHHLDLKKYLIEELYNMHIRVVNLKETSFRAFMLNVIFTINSILP